MRGRGAALLSFLALIGGSASSATAQALDIGGIELRLGQPPEDALRSLASYQVQFVESRWFVSQKIGARYELIGNFSATGDAITFIGKSFPTKSDGTCPMCIRSPRRNFVVAAATRARRVRQSTPTISSTDSKLSAAHTS
jgi:hypothetical protein